MTKPILWTFALALLAAPAFAAGSGAKPAAGHSHAGHDHGPQAATKTVQGEIIDMACWAAHGGGGAKHKGCAFKCITKDGAPAGLLTADGTA